jgi:hypothetical protein
MTMVHGSPGLEARYLLFMIFPGTAMGEELGWRGFALPRLQAGRSALTASLILGALWGGWHFPLYVTGIDVRPLSLFAPWVLLAMASAVIYTWAYNNARGSLLIAVLLHAISNLALTTLLVPLGGERMTTPFLIYVGLTVIAAIVITIASGPEHLSRTHHKLVEAPETSLTPRPEPTAPGVASTSPALIWTTTLLAFPIAGPAGTAVTDSLLHSAEAERRS